jgi:hypothetical protein
VYLFGHFDLDGTTSALFGELNEALLGIREAAQSAGGGASHTHSVHHGAAAAEESRSFMYGIAPEQSQATPWADLVFALEHPGAVP